MHDVASPLSDGRYDAFVVDVGARDEKIFLELTVTSGAHKGEMITVATLSGATVARDPIVLIGLPCILVVENGAPHVEW